MKQLPLLIAGALLAALAHTHAKPNIVFFLVDDLGYMDIGANNPNTLYETPNIDSIAKTGVRFTNGYAANPVCSPTRYSIMTGKYPSRHDATNFFTGRRPGRFKPAPMNSEMPLAEVTIAEALKEAGYATAFAGKWHLGPTEEFWPEKQGFDFNFGGHRAGMPRSFFSPYKNPRLPDGPKGEHLPKRLADESVRFIEQHKDKPFFLYLSFYSVHTPLQGRQDLIDKYKKKIAALDDSQREPAFAEEEQVWPNAKQPRKVRIKQTHAIYGAMMEAMDESIGHVLEALRKNGLEEDTAVFFMSDNGGLSTSEGSPTSNLPLRGGKGWLYEGGIREPYLVKWPGSAKVGSVCDFPVTSTDFYPTILEITGCQPKPAQHLDGRSLVPLLRNPAVALERESLFWHYPHYSNQGGFPGGAIRSGDWKLIERFEDGRTHLYNLANDVGERNDLAKENTDRVARMRESLHQWYKQMDAKFLYPLDNAGPMPWRPGMASAGVQRKMSKEVADLVEAALETNQPDVTTEQEAAACVAIINAFVAAKTTDERLAYVRHPKKVRPLIAAHYREKPNEPKVSKVLLKKKFAIGSRPYITIAVVFDGEDEADLSVDRHRFLSFERTKDAILLDWEVSTGYQKVPLETFKKKKPNNPTPFRVKVAQTDEYGAPFEDEKKYQSVLLTYPGNPRFRLVGFIDKNQIWGAKFAARVEFSSPSVILDLRYPENPVRDDYVEVTRVVHDSWYMP